MSIANGAFNVHVQLEAVPGPIPVLHISERINFVSLIDIKLSTRLMYDVRCAGKMAIRCSSVYGVLRTEYWRGVKHIPATCLGTWRIDGECCGRSG